MTVDVDWLIEETLSLGFDRVLFEDGEVTLFRPGSDEPFGIMEYRAGTRTRKAFWHWEGLSDYFPDGEVMTIHSTMEVGD